MSEAALEPRALDNSSDDPRRRADLVLSGQSFHDVTEHSGIDLRVDGIVAARLGLPDIFSFARYHAYALYQCSVILLPGLEIFALAVNNFDSWDVCLLPVKCQDRHIF